MSRPMGQRERTAIDVLEYVIARIEDQRATFGDLSWAQEALHDLFYNDVNGTPTGDITSQMVPSLDLETSLQRMDVWCNNPAEVIAQVNTLQSGEQLLVNTWQVVFNVAFDDLSEQGIEVAEGDSIVVEVNGRRVRIRRINTDRRPAHSAIDAIVRDRQLGHQLLVFKDGATGDLRLYEPEITSQRPAPGDAGAGRQQLCPLFRRPAGLRHLPVHPDPGQADAQRAQQPDDALAQHPGYDRQHRPGIRQAHCLDATKRSRPARKPALRFRSRRRPTAQSVSCTTAAQPYRWVSWCSARSSSARPTTRSSARPTARLSGLLTAGWCSGSLACPLPGCPARHSGRPKEGAQISRMKQRCSGSRQTRNRSLRRRSPFSARLKTKPPASRPRRKSLPRSRLRRSSLLKPWQSSAPRLTRKKSLRRRCPYSGSQKSKRMNSRCSRWRTVSADRPCAPRLPLRSTPRELASRYDLPCVAAWSAAWASI